MLVLVLMRPELESVASVHDERMLALVLVPIVAVDVALVQLRRDEVIHPLDGKLSKRQRVTRFVAHMLGLDLEMFDAANTVACCGCLADRSGG